MIAPPERSAERDSALEATLPHIPFDGWTRAALRRGLARLGADPRDAGLLFPAGAADMIAAFCDLADRRMAAGMTGSEYAGLRPSARVRAAIALRLAQNRPHREAIRRALAVLALSGNAAVAGACTARTVDAIWQAAGDRAADFSWYTKRALLAGVYTATVLFWLRDAGEDDAATLAFLDRRLAGVRRIGGLRRRAEAGLRGLLPPALRERLP
ncbi:MAG: COQ9 family protein [Acetobacteraceae bacterium]